MTEARAEPAGNLVLRALAGAPGAMSTAEIAGACPVGPSRGETPSKKAWRILRKLADSGMAEVAGKQSQYGNGGPVLMWVITPAGQAWLAEHPEG